MKKPLNYKQLLSAELQKLYSYLDEKQLDYSNDIKAILPHVYSFTSNFMFDKVELDYKLLEVNTTIAFSLYKSNLRISMLTITLYCNSYETYLTHLVLDELSKIFIGDLDDVVTRFEAYYNELDEETKERSS